MCGYVRPTLRGEITETITGWSRSFIWMVGSRLSWGQFDEVEKKHKVLQALKREGTLAVNKTLNTYRKQLE